MKIFVSVFIVLMLQLGAIMVAVSCGSEVPQTAELRWSLSECAHIKDCIEDCDEWMQKNIKRVITRGLPRSWINMIMMMAKECTRECWLLEKEAGDVDILDE